MAEYNEHEMISEGDVPDELLGDDEAAEAAALAAQEKAKKDKKLKVGLWGSFVVLAVGWMGWTALKSPTSPPRNALQVSAPATPPAALSSAGSPGIAGMPTAASVPVMPGGPVANGMPAVAGLPAAPGGPTIGMPNAIDPAQAGGLMPTSPAVPGPVAQQPFPAQGNPGSAIMPGTVAQPAPMGVAASAPAPAPEGFARGLDELGKKIDDLRSMFTKFDEMNIGERLGKLEERVNSLEKSKVGSVAHQGKSMAPAKRRVSVQRPAEQRIVPLSQGEDLLFSRNVDGRGIAPDAPVAVERQPVAAVAVAPQTRGFALHAVIPGRIWIKNGDGSSRTFESGEVLPDGSKIMRIDADRGNVTTSKGTLRFDMN